MLSVVALLALDAAIYLQHVMLHPIPVPWQLHRMHRVDLDVDAATVLRRHPVEILLSTGFRLGGVAALEPPAVAVLAFDVLLKSPFMFYYSNARIPLGLDRTLCWWVASLGIRRVHHLILVNETNSNLGFNLRW